MRHSLPALLLVAALIAGAAQAATPTVQVTLKGMCTTTNHDDALGVVLSSTLNCQAKASCACEGATELVYQTSTLSPGNGAPGREKGTIVASGPHGSVTLALLGQRNTIKSGIAQSKGAWTLGASSGKGATAHAKQGGYTTETTTLTQIIGTTATTVRISASIGCWVCPPAS